MKKSRKTKLGSGEKQTAENPEFEVTENTRNLAAQLSAASGPGPEQQLDGIIDLGNETAGADSRGTLRDGVSEGTCPASAEAGDTGGSKAQTCPDQSTPDCCEEQEAAGQDCTPRPDGCQGIGGAAVDAEPSCE